VQSLGTILQTYTVKMVEIVQQGNIDGDDEEVEDEADENSFRMSNSGDEDEQREYDRDFVNPPENQNSATKRERG